MIDIKEVVGGASCGRQGANREAICRERAAAPCAARRCAQSMNPLPTLMRCTRLWLPQGCGSRPESRRKKKKKNNKIPGKG